MFTSCVNHFLSCLSRGNMSAVVIDFQGFQLSPHSYVVKELAFYDVYRGYHNIWSFQPPHSWDELSSRKQRTYAWVIRNIHGIPWESGRLPYNTFRCVLTSLLASYDTIYVQGLEKAKFLEKFSPAVIINLDDLDCPKIDKLPISAMKCPFHAPQFHYCALIRASAFANFLIQYK